MAVKSSRLRRGGGGGGESIVLKSSINDLDDSLLTEILQRLPTTREAHACKLVSKQWYSLISSTHFASRFVDFHGKHFSMEPKPFASIFNCWKDMGETKFDLVHHIAFKDRFFKSSGFDLSFLPCSRAGHPEDTLVFAAYQDLFLCCSLRFDHRVYYVCNPLTSQWVALPPFPEKHRVWATVGLLCGGSSFRVMRIPDGQSYSRSFIVELFCSEVNEWKMEVVVAPHKFHLGDGLNVFSWDGMMHWFTKDDNEMIAYDPYYPDKCHLIDLPRVEEGHAGRLLSTRVGGYDGGVRLLQLVAIGLDCCVRIWDLMCYEAEEWILAFDVSLCPLLHDSLVSSYWRCSSQRLKIQALALDPNDQNMVYLAYGTSVFSCNVQTNEVKSVSSARLNVTIFGCKWDSYNVHQFVLPWWPTTIPELRS